MTRAVKAAVGPLAGSGLLKQGRRQHERLAGKLELERNLVAFVQRAHARPFDRGDVHKHIGSAVVRLDETKALRGVEPLHSTGRHRCPLSLSEAGNLAEEADDCNGEDEYPASVPSALNPSAPP